MQCNIDNLPDEILEYILTLIPPYRDLRKCMFVSRRWCRITKNVAERNEAHFQKSVAYGSLFWNTCSYTDYWSPMIGKRHSHSACIYENSMYVFGGCTAESTAFNDLWRLDLDTRKWIRPTTVGNYPSPKACATMVYYKKNFILFGGWSQPSVYPLYQQWKLFNELHVYSIETNRWTVKENASENPPPLSAHSASIHKNYMVVFGGMTDEYSTNSVWCLNLETYCWHKQQTSEIQPQSRYGQSQIELDDSHLLIMGGCTGPNSIISSINDVWLLTMEGPVWNWKKVTIHHPEWAPKRILCHQACRTGNYVVVLGKKKRQSQSGDMSISLSKLACRQMPVPQVPNVSAPYERPNKAQEVDRDENVNGRHGTLPRIASRSNAESLNANNVSVTKPVYIFEHSLSMAAFRDETVRPLRPRANRQRQLESLRKMEEKIQSRKVVQKVSKNTEESLAIFILDITNVLCEESSASWVPWKHSEQIGPDERISYSLVLGKGELIVFGGIRKEKVTIQGQTIVDESEVYNDLHFINPPKYKI